jgi:hypothetical protein
LFCFSIPAFARGCPERTGGRGRAAEELDDLPTFLSSLLLTLTATAAPRFRAAKSKANGGVLVL